MRRTRLALLALLCVLSLAAAGCGSGAADTPAASGGAPGETVSDGADTSAEEPASPEEEEPGVGVVRPAPDAVNAVGELVEVANEGKLRISYTGNRSSVVYVTSPSELPGYSELAQYDEAYFEDHALVLVTETMNSGSVDVGILAVNVDGPIATVTLYHGEPEEGQYNTSDMATWLLWAEVETGLDCRWTVANPAMKSDLAAY